MARSDRSSGSGRGRQARSGGRRRPARPTSNRQYPRTARLNALLQEVVAGYFERVSDDELGFLTITGVEVDNDLNRAEVFITTLDDPDPEADAQLLELLESEHRVSVQAKIAAEAKLRKTPEVGFAFDPGVRAGARIEEILETLDLGTDDEPSIDESDDDGDDAGSEDDQGG